MLGTSKLLTFVFRAIVLLLTISIAWMAVAQRYNELLIRLADPLIPDGMAVEILSAKILYDHPDFITRSVTIDSLALHFGLVLLSVVVLAAVGIGIIPRLAWLVMLLAATFATHVLAVGLLAKGFLWAAGTGDPTGSTRLILSVFAVYWGLLPAAAGGIWCFAYWLPRMRKTADEEENVEDTILQTEHER